MENGVKIVWILFLGIGGVNVCNGCYECCEDRVFKQYVVLVEFLIFVKFNGYWFLYQVIGVLDVELCNLIFQVWSVFFSMEFCLECYIEFGFKEVVIFMELFVWVVWNVKVGVINI